MVNVDKIKEELNSYRTFLTLSVAILIAIASWLSKLYLSNETANPLFWIGITLSEYFGIISIILITQIKNKLNELNNMEDN